MTAESGGASAVACQYPAPNMRMHAVTVGSLAIAALAFACNTAAMVTTPGASDAPSPTEPANTTTGGSDAGEPSSTTPSDASDGDASDATAPDADVATSDDDGTPTRNACTDTLGKSLTGADHGRLDGYLVSIIQPGTKDCNGDSDHVHLQIEMNGADYDIAVNVDGVLTLQESHALVDGAWAEGWHAGDELDFVNDLGLHATDFTAIDEATATKQVNDFLAAANHVSIYATHYDDFTGAHLIHRQGNGDDGALVIDPLSSSPKWLLFHFPEQDF